MAGEPILGDGVIGRLAFITIIIISFYIFLRIGIVILAYVYGENKSPHLIDGMVKTNNYKLIKQDPRIVGSKPGTGLIMKIREGNLHGPFGCIWIKHKAS